MASRKQKRYGQGGMNHKHTPNLKRANGKAFKQHPKGFNTLTRSLVTVGQSLKGTTDAFLN